VVASGPNLIEVPEIVTDPLNWLHEPFPAACPALRKSKRCPWLVERWRPGQIPQHPFGPHQRNTLSRRGRISHPDLMRGGATADGADHQDGTGYY
jgi:hypothetical protein